MHQETSGEFYLVLHLAFLLFSVQVKLILVHF